VGRTAQPKTLEVINPATNRFAATSHSARPPTLARGVRPHARPSRPSRRRPRGAHRAARRIVAEYEEAPRRHREGDHGGDGRPRLARAARPGRHGRGAFHDRDPGSQTYKFEENADDGDRQGADWRLRLNHALATGRSTRSLQGRARLRPGCTIVLKPSEIGLLGQKSSPRSSTRRASRRASSTSSTATDRRPAQRSARIRCGHGVLHRLDPRRHRGRKNAAMSRACARGARGRARNIVSKTRDDGAVTTAVPRRS